MYGKEQLTPYKIVLTISVEAIASLISFGSAIFFIPESERRVFNKSNNCI